MKKIETLLGNIIPFWPSYVTGIVASDLCGPKFNLTTGFEKDFIAILVMFVSYFVWRLPIVWIESKFDKKKLQKIQDIKTTIGNVFAVILSIISAIVVAMLIWGYENEWYIKRYGRPILGKEEISSFLFLFITFLGIWLIIVASIENALWKRKVKKRTNKKK